MAFAICLAISREHTCDIIVLGMCLWDPPGDAGRHEDTPDNPQLVAKWAAFEQEQFSELAFGDG